MAKKTPRNSFIFYRSFYESIKLLPQENQLKIYESIAEFSLNEKKIDLEGIQKSIFILIKPQLEANRKRFKNGCRPKKSKIEANNKQTISKSEANLNLNLNVNDNENVKKEIDKKERFNFIENQEWKTLIKEWVDYKKSQFRFSYKSDNSLKAFYSQLLKFSNNNLKIAKEIINKSIANGYKGIFEIKQNSSFNSSIRNKGNSRNL